jgi:hypothetical protein
MTAVWQLVGLVELAGNGHRLTMPSPLPTDAGVYTIMAKRSREIYVGEGASLSRRLKDYENAGWMPNTFSRTNRTVQGWIFEGITTKQDTFEIHVCTEAHFASDGSDSIPLNLQQKYYRALVEAAAIACQANTVIINKQYEVDCANLHRKLDHLRSGESQLDSFCRSKDISLGYLADNPQNDAAYERRFDELFEAEAQLEELRNSISAIERHMRKHGCTPVKEA